MGLVERRARVPTPLTHAFFPSSSRYHSRCLKIARGKIKEEDKYTCPICDWRVKIPRDATRPKVEDLIDWRDEVPGLPFQPEEEEVLTEIIDNALTFRRHVQPFMDLAEPTSIESETQRFFLRKIEGAEILLSRETNHLRQVLHSYYRVVSEPPPVRDSSLSTRKPRPTKLQKLLAEHKVDRIEDLPEDARNRAQTLRRKQLHQEAVAAANAGSGGHPGGVGGPHHLPPLMGGGGGGAGDYAHLQSYYNFGHQTHHHHHHGGGGGGDHLAGLPGMTPHPINTDVGRNYSHSLHSASGSEVSSIKDTPTGAGHGSVGGGTPGGGDMALHPAFLGSPTQQQQQQQQQQGGDEAKGLGLMRQGGGGTWSAWSASPPQHGG
jgi:histone demethylase JARID1